MKIALLLNVFFISIVPMSIEVSSLTINGKNTPILERTKTPKKKDDTHSSDTLEISTKSSTSIDLQTLIVNGLPRIITRTVSSKK